MNKCIISVMLFMSSISCVNLKNNSSINGVYIGRNEDEDYRLELNRDSAFRYTLGISCFPKSSMGKWYILSHNSILLVCDFPGKNPLFLLAELLVADRKIKLKFKNKEKLKWKDENHKVHILYRKPSM